MALTEKHRSAIYQHLSPIVGEEATEAMLMHFPRTDADEPITREHLDRRFAEIDTRFAQIDTRFEQLRTEVHQLHNRTIVWGISAIFAGNAALFALLNLTLG
jgi:hypothetical protein